MPQEGRNAKAHDLWKVFHTCHVITTVGTMAELIVREEFEVDAWFSPPLPFNFEPWIYIATALLLFSGAMWHLRTQGWPCCVFFVKGTKEPIPMKQAGAKQTCPPCSENLQWSRLPTEPADLATFVTRRPSVWARHQLAGEDCFLILD